MYPRMRASIAQTKSINHTVCLRYLLDRYISVVFSQLMISKWGDYQTLYLQNRLLDTSKTSIESEPRPVVLEYRSKSVLVVTSPVPSCCVVTHFTSANLTLSFSRLWRSGCERLQIHLKHYTNTSEALLALPINFSHERWKRCNYQEIRNTLLGSPRKS